MIHYEEALYQVYAPLPLPHFRPNGSLTYLLRSGHHQSVASPAIRKSGGYLDRRKTESVHIQTNRVINDGKNKASLARVADGHSESVIHLQGSSRTGTHGNAIPVLFYTTGTSFPLFFFCIPQLLTAIRYRTLKSGWIPPPQTPPLSTPRFSRLRRSAFLFLFIYDSNTVHLHPFSSVHSHPFRCFSVVF